MATAQDTLLTVLKMEGQDAYVAGITAAAQAQHKASQEEQASDRARRSAIEGIHSLTAAYQAQIGIQTRHAVMAGVVSAGFIGMAREAINAAAATEQVHIAMNTLAGGAAAGNKLFEDIRVFAKQTPYQFAEWTAMAPKAMAYGFKPDELIGVLRTVGDAASATGKGAEGMERIIMSLGQMQARGKVTGMEMRELANAGIPVVRILAAGLGVTTQELEKMQMAGIDAGKAIPLLLEGMKAQFGGAMINQMQSATGKLSNFKDATHELAVSVGNELLPQLKEIITTGISIANTFANLPQGVKAVGAVGTVVVVVGASIYGVVAAGKAWSYQTQVNVMQQALLTAELERQNITLDAGAAGMTRRGGMMRTGMGIAGGAAAGAVLGTMTGGYLANAGMGAGIAGAAGEMLAGGAAGLLMSGGNPIAGAAGALAALTAAALKATQAIGEMSEKADAAQWGAENKTPWALAPAHLSIHGGPDIGPQLAAAMGGVPVSKLTEDQTRYLLQPGSPWGGRYGPGLPQGGTVVRTDKRPRTREELLRLLPGVDLGGWDKGTVADALREWGAGMAPLGPHDMPPALKASTDAAAAAGSPEAQAKEFSDLAKSYKDLPGYQAQYLATLDAEIAKHQEIARPLEAELATKEDIGTRTKYNTELQAIHNLELEKGAVATAQATAAEKERAGVLERLSKAFTDMQAGASAYTGLLNTLGTDAMDPLMRQALGYQSQLGLQQAQNAMPGSAEYYGGLNQAASAQKEMLGPAGGHIKGLPGWDPRRIPAPWQTGFGQNAMRQYQMHASIVIWAQRPDGNYEQWPVRNYRGEAMMGAGAG